MAYFEGKDKVIPNDVETVPERNVSLITGANNNGKTCYISGLGLSQALFQAGLPILSNRAALKIKEEINVPALEISSKEQFVIVFTVLKAKD